MGLTRRLVEIRGAAFRYGEREVFKDLNLDVFAGEVVCILGPNGCGKSTLLRCISGGLALAEGTVRLEGTDVFTLDAAARARRIAFLFQQHTPSFAFPVLQVVSMGRAPYLGLFGAPSAKDVTLAEQALDKVGILHLKDRAYTEVSGGERQLVLLARTLAQEPALILLDEPTSHLDLRNQVMSLRTIGSLAGRGIAMVMTTHDPNHAFLFPGRVMLMQRGGAIITGPASEVLNDKMLSSTFGVDIAVVSVQRRDGSGERRICSPWLS
jgi:iron complex transport system ATP-binding protein